MKKIFKLIFVLFLSTQTALGCESKEIHLEEPPVVSTSHVSDITVSELQDLASSFGFEEQKNKLIYDVRIDKIIYTTSYKGKQISASGLMFTPKANKAFPVLSSHHATTFQKSGVPSVSLRLSGEEFIALSP